MSVLSTHGTLIHAEDLICVFGAVRALDGVGLDVTAGEIHTLLGSNGAGKSSLVRILATLQRPTSGRASVCGYDVVSQRRRVRERIAVAGQGTSVDEALTGRENLRVIAGLHGLTARDSRERANVLLDEVDLASAGDRPVKTYSGGMRRRLDLAASLVTRPEVLFVDEPTTGLDPRAKNTIWNLIRRRAADGCAVLLTTQDLTEAQALATQITVLGRGQAIASGTPADLRADVGQLSLRMSTNQGDTVDSVPDIAAGLQLATQRLARLDHNERVQSLTIDNPSLTDVYLTLTGERQ